MKKMCITMHHHGSNYRVCTEDLAKMYYFHKKTSPRLPSYSRRTLSDCEDLNSSQALTMLSEKQHAECLES